MGTVDSKKFDLLLAHFLRDAGPALSAPAAAGLSGFGVGAALGVLRILEREGILRSSLRGRRRFFRADARSGYYRRCRIVYAAQARLLN